MHAPRHTTAILLAFAMLLAAASAAVAAPLGQRAGKGLGEERMVALRGSASGTVLAIDAANRQLKLRGKLGEASFRVDRKAGALDAIKAGDSVRLEYVAAIGLTVRRGGGEPRVSVEAPSKAGGRSRITAVVRVLAIDTERPMIRVQGPKGREAEFPVQDKADLAGLKVGDLLVGVVYELAAVEVAPGGR